MTFDPTEHPHRRLNPLTGRWVQVSPHRMKRPWQGQQEKPAQDDKPQYDPDCYLCPTNTRTSGETNPDYDTTFVFDNDFRALLDGVPDAPDADSPFFQAQAVNGTNRVICFSPRHDLTLAEMSVPEIRTVVDLWVHQTADLGQTYQWVQVFENRGAMMGSSNPHPHGQIWAIDTLPEIPTLEDAHQYEYYAKHNSPMLLDYARAEVEKGERVVAQNDDWVAVVPYWAVWPFETLLMPLFPVKQMPDVQESQRDALAHVVKQLLVRYDNLFEVSFAYSMGWHGAPFNGEANNHWQLHAHFYPPLLRSATVRKFMVGYEMLSEPQRDLTAEQAAKRLQEVSAVHYKERN